MKSNTALVTAFFDINRSKFKTSKLDNSKYFEYFKFVAHLQNDLFIFTDNEKHKEKIEKIRKEYCPNFITKVYIEKLDQLDPNLYQNLSSTFKRFDQSKIRKYPNRPECLYINYCFINIVKFIFLSRIIDLNKKYDSYAWIDFGFNHGQQYYSSPVSLPVSLESLKLKISIPDNKLILFKTPEKDASRKSIAELYITLDTPILGGLQIGSKEAWICHDKNMRKAINSISSLGIVDDDQLYLVHCYRNNENDYFLLPTTEWFDSLSYTFPTGSEVKINIKITKYKFWLSLYNEYIKNNNFIKAAHSACMAAFFYLIKRKAQCTQTSIVRIDNKIHIAS